MSNVTNIINVLPEYQGRVRKIRTRQTITDIMQDLLYKHKKNEADCLRICKQFWKGDARSTAKYLFDFCKGNIYYKEEDVDNQSVKSISGILTEGEGDCKHYSQMIVGICTALQSMGYPISAKYRFAIYNDKPNDKGVKTGHVFAVVMDKVGEIWCDPVLRTFDQRTPMYIKNFDKVPHMSFKMGTVWEVTGVNDNLSNTTLSGLPNGATLSGLPNDTTLSGLPMNITLGTTYEREVDSAGVGWVDEYYGVGRVRHHHHRHHNNFLDRAFDSPLNPLHPGIYTPGLAEHIGYADDTMGKAHKKKAKKPHKHIKIQPGKLFKKVALAPNRNAFLLYLKLNLFHTGSEIYQKMNQNPAFKQHFFDMWKKIGGNPNKLQTALTQAMHVWNQHHKAHRIGPMAGQAEHVSKHRISGDSHLMLADEIMGVVQLAIPALLAAAAPIIKIFTDLLKKAGISHAGKDDTDAAEQQTIDDHNNATDEKGDGNKDIKDDGSVDHGNGITTKVDVDPATGKQTLSYDAKDPTADGGDDEVTTKTKTTTKHTGVDDQGDEVTTTTKEKSITKVDSGDDNAAPTGIAAFWDKTKSFIGDHKIALPLTVGGGVVLLYSFTHKFPKKSSAPVIMGLLGAGALVGGGMMLFKKPAQ